MGKLNLPYDKPSRLTFKEGNPKTDKNKSVEGLESYRILRLNLAPYNLSGYQVKVVRLLVCILRETQYFKSKKTRVVSIGLDIICKTGLVFWNNYSKN